MLQILSMCCPYSNKKVPADLLFRENKVFTFEVEAPLYWWVDFDGMKYGFDLSPFSPVETQQLSVSTKVTAWVSLTYQQIIQYCQDYIHGEYLYDNKYYHWFNEREWSDFCETLMDIAGVKDLLFGEEI